MTVTGAAFALSAAATSPWPEPSAPIDPDRRLADSATAHSDEVATAGSPAYGLLAQAVMEARSLAHRAMERAIATLDPQVRRVCTYHFGWTDVNGMPVVTNQGKLLRPTLALLSARAAGGSAAAGVPAAVAVEFVHAFSMLHDDIMDGDVERRHRPTAWRAFGVPMAILAGDALLSAAAAVLLEVPGDGARAAGRRLSIDVQRLIGGQCVDLGFEQRTDVTLVECLAMAEGKTGALMASACAIGAELVGCSPDLAQSLAWCGNQLGLVFQLVDDLLGIWGEAAVTGKPIFSDIRNRKKSLPIVAALTSGTHAGRELERIYCRAGDPLDERAVVRIADLVERAGGRAWAERAVADRLVDLEAKIAGLPLPAPVRAAFEEIAAFFADRSH